jgi:hypothetical protein
VRARDQANYETVIADAFVSVRSSLPSTGRYRPEADIAPHLFSVTNKQSSPRDAPLPCLRVDGQDSDPAHARAGLTARVARRGG